VSGVETLSVHHPDLGSLVMPKEWTDWARPGTQPYAAEPPLLVDVFGLCALADVIASLRRDPVRS
jgi:hypothetical protein